MSATNQDNGPILLEKLKDIGGKPSDIILIFGKTRAGKSTFINDVKGKKVVKSTSSMKSDTMDISAVEVTLSDGRTVYLIDTIGFGGSGVDHSHTDLAARYVNLFHNKDGSKGPKISAFLYFIDIKDAAGLDAGSKLNLPFVDAFIGKGLHPSLCFVTNKWSKDEDEREEEEEREKEWKSELGNRFPKARVTQIHYNPPRASEIKLAKMSERDRKKEQDKYRESALGLVESALKKPASDHTLLEKEIRVKPLVGQTSLFQAAVISTEKDIQAMENEGKRDVANVMREEMQNIGNTKVEDAGDVALSRRIAREAGRKAMGKKGEVIGEWVNWAAERVIGAYSVFATEKQANALQKAYHGRMVPRTAAMTNLGADIAGTPGAMVATAAGTALNYVDGAFTHLFNKPHA